MSVRGGVCVCVCVCVSVWGGARLCGTALNFIHLKPDTHQTNIKELVETKGVCCVASRPLGLGQKVALEHTAKTTAN